MGQGRREKDVSLWFRVQGLGLGRRCIRVLHVWGFGFSNQGTFAFMIFHLGFQRLLRRSATMVRQSTNNYRFAGVCMVYVARRGSDFLGNPKWWSQIFWTYVIPLQQCSHHDYRDPFKSPILFSAQLRALHGSLCRGLSKFSGCFHKSTRFLVVPPEQAWCSTYLPEETADKVTA